MRFVRKSSLIGLSESVPICSKKRR